MEMDWGFVATCQCLNVSVAGHSDVLGKHVDQTPSHGMLHVNSPQEKQSAGYCNMSPGHIGQVIYSP